jgi:hypothetical protein
MASTPTSETSTPTPWTGRMRSCSQIHAMGTMNIGMMELNSAVLVAVVVCSPM